MNPRTTTTESAVSYRFALEAADGTDRIIPVSNLIDGIYTGDVRADDFALSIVPAAKAEGHDDPDRG